MTISTKFAEPGMCIPYQTMSEITAGALAATVAAIHERRTQKLPSYGAYIIRKGGYEIFEQATELIAAQLPPTIAHIEPLTFKFYGTANHLLHTDQGIPNDITAYWLKKGRADIVVLNDLDNATLGALEFLSDFSDMLFSQAEYPYELHGTPLRDELRTDDILLFDHTLPHAVKSLTKDRRSEGRFFARDVIAHYAVHEQLL